MTDKKVDLIAKCIRTFPDFPTKGIPFKDICPILKDPKALAAVTDLFEEHVRRTYPQVDLIVGKRVHMRVVWHATRFKLVVRLLRLQGKCVVPAPILPIRKVCKLRRALETPGVLFFSLGTLYAACELIKQQKAEVLGCLVVVELKYLSGSEKLQSTPVFSLIQY
uniref:adenine phosphoribosyltransferase n=1 Tax=Sinocyclocheilus rhinocerous TaxID=307959 RepID=A0A673GCL6_9TELE